DCAAAAQASMSTLVFTPSLLDFGASYAEGYNNSLERTLTITNTATAPSIPVEFQIDDIRTGSNGVISPVEHFGTLAAGQTQTFVVVFKWTGGEQITTPLVLRSTGPIHDSISVPVFAAAGYGYLVFDDPPGPPAGISAPAVAAGETSSVTIRAHNEGIISLIVDVSTSLGIGGTAEVQSPSSVRVAPGQSVEWTITCTPDGIPPYEAGADGAIDFQYTYAAGNLDSIQLFCPVLGSSQPPASSSGRR
ncbi:MAG: hypothetical protein ABIY55_17390, partial [Kofleriaceae bacterium]